jgi:hypothetical protein
MKRPSFFLPCLGLAATMALTLFAETALAAKSRMQKAKKPQAEKTEKKALISEDLTHPTFRTLTATSCPKEQNKKVKEEWEKGEWESNNCSRAKLMYPRYKKTPWINRLIAKAVILPMFAERLEEKSAREGNEAHYKGKLKDLVRKGGARGSVEKPPIIDFAATLAGSENSSLSPAGVPRPELFGSYLQFKFVHELNQRYDTNPSGPQGSFIVIDIRSRKILSFNDLIVPGQEKALENLQRAAFLAWLKKERKLPDASIKAHLANPSYALRLNKNWRITEGGLVFRFAPREVGPRPFGSPEIFVGKDHLQRIIQPGILEQIPGRELTAGN